MKIKNYLDESPAMRTLAAAAELEKSIARRLKPYRVNLFQALILVGVYSEDSKEVRSSDLLKVFGTTKGNISQTISVLESLGLLKRKVNPKDRRSCSLALTERGRSLSVKLITSFDRLQAESEAALRPPRVKEFTQSLRILMDVHGSTFSRSE